ncbi:MAG: hypothetical protein U9Q07_04170 [Planctomycetota bacterium]|nr:hypothetical protein [Planctomycetota bacterium]
MPVRRRIAKNTTDIATNAAAIAAMGSVYQFKGAITAAADFPISALVQVGWTYHVTTAVTDNDPTKTNTGQSFAASHEIAWDGTAWVDLGPALTEEECSVAMDMKVAGNNALVAPGAAAQQFTPTSIEFQCLTATALNGDTEVTVGTAAGGTQILPITVLTGLSTVGQKFVINVHGLIPAVAGASALDITITTADTGTTGTMTGVLRGSLR